MSEYKLEDAETVALSDATKIIGLDANGVPCWIDPASLAQGGFKAWLDNHSDIVNYWWPDKSDVGLLAKSGARCIDFNSLDVDITTSRDGVRVYAAEIATNQNLKFNARQDDQLTVERSEIGIFYVDPLVVSGSQAKLMNCVSGGNYQGFLFWYANSGANTWRIDAYGYPYGTSPMTAIFGTDTPLSGWVMVHGKTTIDRIANTIDMEVTVSGATPLSGVLDGTKQISSGVFRINSAAYLSETYAAGGIFPAFYAKSRVPLTEVEADDIFNRFKAGYGIA